MTVKDYSIQPKKNQNEINVYISALEEALTEIHIISTLAANCDEDNICEVGCCISAMSLISAKAKVVFN